jgi:hypothetical protein
VEEDAEAMEETKDSGMDKSKEIPGYMKMTASMVLKDNTHAKVANQHNKNRPSRFMTRQTVNSTARAAFNADIGSVGRVTLQEG